MRIFSYFNALDIATCFHHLYMDLFLVIDKLNLLKVWLIILLFRTYAHNPIYRFLMLAINHLSISHIVVSSWIQPLAPILLVNVDEQKPFRFIVKFCKHSVFHRYNRMSPHLHTTNFVNSCLQNFCYFRKKIFLENTSSLGHISCNKEISFPSNSISFIVCCFDRFSLSIFSVSIKISLPFSCICTYNRWQDVVVILTSSLFISYQKITKSITLDDYIHK